MSDDIIAQRWGDNKPGAVAQIQEHLGQLGLYKGKQDRIFSAQTQTAVINFQRQVGLPAN